MITGKADALASRLGISPLATKILLGLGYTKNTIERVVKLGREQGKIVTKYEYELETLFGITKGGK